MSNNAPLGIVLAAISIKSKLILNSEADFYHTGVVVCFHQGVVWTAAEAEGLKKDFSESTSPGITGRSIAIIC